MRAVLAVLAFPYRLLLLLLEFGAVLLDWLAKRKEPPATVLTPEQEAYFAKLEELRESSQYIDDPEWDQRTRKLLEDAKRKVTKR